MNSVATLNSTLSPSNAARLPDTLSPPASPSITFTIPDAPPVNRSNSPEEVIDADVEIANTLLLNVHQVWGAVTTLAGVCKLAETTMTLLEKRRAMLLQPFGAPTSAKRTVIMPLE